MKTAVEISGKIVNEKNNRVNTFIAALDSTTEWMYKTNNVKGKIIFPFKTADEFRCFLNDERVSEWLNKYGFKILGDATDIYLTLNIQKI